MLGKIEGRRRKRQLDGITDSMDMSLSKLQVIVKDREAWHSSVRGVSKCRTRLSDQTATICSFRSLNNDGMIKKKMKVTVGKWLMKN